MKKFKNFVLVSVILVIALIFTGCSFFSRKPKEDPAIEQTAIEYVTNISKGSWDNVLAKSTGDQLAIYMQLVPILQEAKQTSDLKIIEVVDKEVFNKLAFVTVHFVRTVNLPDYGSVMDDKQVLLYMKKIDGEWKVFRLDVVNDLKTKLDG